MQTADLLTLQIQTEFLSQAEVEELTGRKLANDQKSWLESQGWSFAVNAHGRPIVGRAFARLKLSGITPIVTVQKSDWSPDFKTLKRHEAKEHRP